MGIFKSILAIGFAGSVLHHGGFVDLSISGKQEGTLVAATTDTQESQDLLQNCMEELRATGMLTALDARSIVENSGVQHKLAAIQNARIVVSKYRSRGTNIQMVSGLAGQHKDDDPLPKFLNIVDRSLDAMEDTLLWLHMTQDSWVFESNQLLFDRESDAAEYNKLFDRVVQIRNEAIQLAHTF